MYKMIATQMGVVIFFAFLLLFDSTKAAYSLLLGGFCCLIPNFIFARQLFARQGATQVKRAVKTFYRGEVFKLALISLLSVMVFIWVAIAPLYFFGGFLIAQLAFWFIGVLSMRPATRSVEVNS